MAIFYDVDTDNNTTIMFVVTQNVESVAYEEYVYLDVILKAKKTHSY